MADNDINSGMEQAARVHEALSEKGLMLALAESCTGGYISHLLTSIPGASNYLNCSVVAYSEKAKIKLLGVNSKLIDKNGTISPECALAMARGAARACGTKVALAVTGNLGPEPIEGKEVGLVHAAVYMDGKAMTREFRFSGDRISIKKQAASAALELLFEAVTGWG